jgi:hypothetical protein
MALRWRTEPLWLSAQRYLEWRHGQTGMETAETYCRVRRAYDC